MEHADTQLTQSNRREFDVKEGIVDIFGGLGGEEKNAARGGHRKACGCDGHGRGGNGGQGSTSPKAVWRNCHKKEQKSQMSKKITVNFVPSCGLFPWSWERTEYGITNSRAVQGKFA